MQNKVYSRWPVTGSLLLFLLVCFSCRDKDKDPAPVKSEHEPVNTWILGNMEFWYLWENELPPSPDKNNDPETFFNSLLSPEDRFSWIQDNYIELINSLQGVSKEAGYEFVLYKDSNAPDNVIAQIVYIKPASPAESAGLKRGDLITHINDQQLSVANYQTVLEDISENHTIRYKPLLIEEERFDVEKTITLATMEYAENPNYLSKIIEIDDKKVGYYVYNFFASGPGDETTVYDEQMDATFADFNAQGVTDMILDLRFNSGGSETSANNLASLIGTGVGSSKIFFKREYNEQVEAEILNDPQGGEAYLSKKFLDKTQNIGNQLNGNRIYILTSSRTASASELLINGLKPYMDIFLIGSTTYGKNVGSISLYEENNPENTWGMQPIVMRAYNSLNQSDYSNGFVPHIAEDDNSVFIYPLGDRREELLRQALEQITGHSIPARKRTQREKREVLGFSLDTKKRSFTLNVDDVPKILNGNR